MSFRQVATLGLVAVLALGCGNDDGIRVRDDRPSGSPTQTAVTPGK